MKSPRFDLRAAKIRRIFTPKNIERIWRDKVRVSMRQQFLSDGVEDLDFHISIESESQKLSKLILTGEYVPQRANRILVEKGKGLCRQIVIPGIRDAIVLQCLSDSLYNDIRGKAPTNRSFFEPKDHRFHEDKGHEYGTFASWLNFQKNLFNFTKIREFIVITDIANYYDSISYVHLRNAIAGISGVEECILDMLIFVLGDLLWQPDYTPRVEVGLPQINLDAPRLLAHCFLFEMDEFLGNKQRVDFVRFMDDIDVGVDTIVDAKNILREIDLVLQAKQVRLNGGKTIILSKDDALKHFRVFENARIDVVKRAIDRKRTAGLPLDREIRLVQKRIRTGLKKKSFDAGNGEKILKRWIGIAGDVGARISQRDLEQVIRLRPASRAAVFAYIRRGPATVGKLRALTGAAKSGLLSDEAAMVELSNNLVETKIDKRHGLDGEIKEIIASCDLSGLYQTYCKLWLQSKYGTPDELMLSLVRGFDTWSPSVRLGRMVAAFRPVFVNSPIFPVYENLVSRAANDGCQNVSRFHLMLSSDKLTFANTYPMLRQSNPSRGTGITHPKFLCLLSALMNNNAPATQVKILRTANKRAFEDVYYRGTAKRLRVY